MSDTQPIDHGGEESPPAEDNVTVLPVLTAPGGRLRAARETAGLGLSHVVEALKVEKHLVEAMESNRFEAFDAPVYARGFLRKYAAFLGLSTEDLLADFDTLGSRPPPPSHVPLTTAAPRVRDWSRIRSALGIAAALLVVIGSFFWWHGRNAAPAPRAVTAAVQPVLPAADTPDTQAPPPGTASGAAVSAPAVSGTDGPAVAPPATTAAEGAAPALAVSGPEAGGGARRLAFELSGDSWVEVTGADGNRQFRAMLHAGDARTLVGKGPWRVLIGKADVVRVTLDGAPLSPGPEFRRGDTALYHVDQHGTLY